MDCRPSKLSFDTISPMPGTRPESLSNHPASSGRPFLPNGRTKAGAIHVEVWAIEISSLQGQNAQRSDSMFMAE
jgi:hypothetical protein